MKPYLGNALGSFLASCFSTRYANPWIAILRNTDLILVFWSRFLEDMKKANPKYRGWQLQEGN